MKVLISRLSPYPWNDTIYGNVEDTELSSAEFDELCRDISEHGILKAPVVDQDCLIIEGNRRVQAAFKLGFEEIEVEQMHFENEMERVIYLLSTNKYRTKTNEIKARERIYWETTCEKYAAHLREKAQNGEELNDSSFRNLIDKEAMAKIMPDRTFRKAKKVTNKIDELKAEGKVEQAEELSGLLNTNITAAERKVEDWEKAEEKEINEAESNDLDELKEKGPKKPKIVEDPAAYDEDLYWYWKDLEALTKKMRATVSSLKNSPRYNHTTPTALIWIISNIIKVCEKFETWNPKEVGYCEVCEGTGTAEDGTQCGHCIQGKNGYYIVPKE